MISKEKETQGTFRSGQNELMATVKIKRRAPLPLIGWKERVSLPRLDLGPLVAKVDTGARSAALHAENITVTGRKVRFDVPLYGHVHRCELPMKGVRRVRASSGHAELRIVVETEVEIGEARFPVEITLTDRTDMGVPMLLGRASVRGRYLVHPGRSFIACKLTR
jgi:hypothetical protein